MPDLQHLVQQRLDELSRHEGRRVTPRQAAKIPGAPSYETIRKIVRGEHSGQLKESVVQGLQALGISRPEILRATNQTRVAELPTWNPPAMAHRLTLRQRRVVEAVIFALTDDRDSTGTENDPVRISDAPHTGRGLPPTVSTERVQLTPDIGAVLGRLGEVAASSPELRDELATFSEDLFRRYGEEQTGGS